MNETLPNPAPESPEPIVLHEQGKRAAAFTWEGIDQKLAHAEAGNPVDPTTEAFLGRIGDLVQGRVPEITNDDGTVEKGEPFNVLAFKDEKGVETDIDIPTQTLAKRLVKYAVSLEPVEPNADDPKAAVKPPKAPKASSAADPRPNLSPRNEWDLTRLGAPDGGNPSDLLMSEEQQLNMLKLGATEDNVADTVKPLKLEEQRRLDILAAGSEDEYWRQSAVARVSLPKLMAEDVARYRKDYAMAVQYAQTHSKGRAGRKANETLARTKQIYENAQKRLESVMASRYKRAGASEKEMKDLTLLGNAKSKQELLDNLNPDRSRIYVNLEDKKEPAEKVTKEPFRKPRMSDEDLDELWGRKKPAAKAEPATEKLKPLKRITKEDKDILFGGSATTDGDVESSKTSASPYSPEQILEQIAYISPQLSNRDLEILSSQVSPELPEVKAYIDNELANRARSSEASPLPEAIPITRRARAARTIGRLLQKEAA